MTVMAMLDNDILVWLLPIVVWEVVWKGIGLWHSARRGHKVWFIVLLVLNTAGVLPIVYLLLNRSRDRQETESAG